MAIHQDLTKLTQEQLIAMLVAQQVQAQRKLTCKVSAKGAVSLYGMGRWPVTLYAEQWQRVLGEADAIRAFIKANAASLSTKGDAAPALAA